MLPHGPGYALIRWGGGQRRVPVVVAEAMKANPWKRPDPVPLEACADWALAALEEVVNRWRDERRRREAWR